VEVLRLASVEARRGTTNSGTFNVAGDGVLLLSQAARRLGRPTLPLLLPAVSWVAGLARQTRVLDFSPEQMRLLTHGRVVDTTQLRETFGYNPAFSTEAALADLACSTRAGLLPPARVARWTSRVAELLPVGGGDN
jgi:UDP-glucose 4-epimerase